MTKKSMLASLVVALGLIAPATAASQGSTPPPPSPPDTRKATTTTSGDTGLWFVPSGEILPAGKWSASAYRVNVDFEQGFTDVSNWLATFAFGVKDRAELFGAFTFLNRI